MSKPRMVSVGLVVVLGGTVSYCSSPPPPPATPPRAVRRAPAPPPAPRPVAESSCRSLYAHYQHETARIPYPADLPLRTLLPMGAKILGRYRLPADDAVCVALMRSMLGRFFVRRTGPGIGVGGRTYGKK